MPKFKFTAEIEAKDLNEAYLIASNDELGSFIVVEIKPDQNIAWYQSWEESEREWGQRPDGYSLHLTEQDAKDYIKSYMDGQKEQLGERTPDEYTRPAGSPYRVIITDKTYANLQESGTVRVYQHTQTLASEIPKPLDKESGWATPKL